MVSNYNILTEPDGTILKFTVYTGTLDDFGGKGHAANIVGTPPNGGKVRCRTLFVYG